MAINVPGNVNGSTADMASPMSVSANNSDSWSRILMMQDDKPQGILCHYPLLTETPQNDSFAQDSDPGGRGGD